MCVVCVCGVCVCVWCVCVCVVCVCVCVCVCARAWRVRASRVLVVPPCLGSPWGWPGSCVGRVSGAGLVPPFLVFLGPPPWFSSRPSPRPAPPSHRFSGRAVFLWSQVGHGPPVAPTSPLCENNFPAMAGLYSLSFLPPLPSPTTKTEPVWPPVSFFFFLLCYVA